MSTSFNPPRNQRGDMLIESLVGVLVMAVIGAGLAKVSAGVMNSKFDSKMDYLAVEQLRTQMQIQGQALCGGASAIKLPGADNIPESAAVAVECLPVAAPLAMNSSAGGASITAPPEIALTVASAALKSRNDIPLVVRSNQNGRYDL
jgi:Tfp pilus assembly protein PilV